MITREDLAQAIDDVCVITPDEVILIHLMYNDALRDKVVAADPEMAEQLIREAIVAEQKQVPYRSIGWVGLEEAQYGDHISYAVERLHILDRELEQGAA